MSEMGQVSVGQALREAREAQGIAVEAVAQRLHLMQRQVEAMESDDFDSLGQPVFARGFVRNYARMLGLAPEVLLARMVGAPAEPTAVVHVAPPMSRSWLTSPWLIMLLLGVLLLAAVPVGLYLWLNSDVDNGPVNHTLAEQRRSVPVSKPVAAVTAPVPAPAAALPDGVPTGSAQAELAIVPAAPATAPVPDAASVTTLVAPAPLPTAGAKGALRMVFNAESWTEVKDASGRTLLRKLNPAGSSVDLQGQPPFDMVIGSAAQVQVTYNGRPIDLKPFIDVTVARFTLEE